MNQLRSKRALKNILITLLLQIITIFCGFIVPKLIISNYGSEMNGLLSSITQFLAYITLLEAGVGPVVKATLYKPISQKNTKDIINILKTSENFFKKIAYIFIVYILLLCCIYPTVINDKFDVLFTISLILIMSLSTLTEYYLGITYRIFLSSLQETYVISITQILVTIFNTIGIVLFIFLGLNIIWVKLMTAIIFIIKPIFLSYYVKKKYKIHFRDEIGSYKLEKKWDGLAQHVANIIYENTDIVILTLFATLNDVSIYAVYILVIKGIKSLIEALTSGIDSSFGDMIARKEQENLSNSFKIYEFVYLTIITIICISTIVLIVPFIKVYTMNISDANYVQPLFGLLLSIAGFIYEIRLPYSLLTQAAGCFKETRNGAWLEAIMNVAISMFLVFKLGLIGVALGTIIAVLFRTIEFMIYTSKYILNRKIMDTFKWFVIIIFETFVIYLVNNLFFSQLTFVSYGTWFVYALFIFVLTTFFVVIINYMWNRNTVYNLKYLIKKVLKK